MFRWQRPRSERWCLGLRITYWHSRTQVSHLCLLFWWSCDYYCHVHITRFKSYQQSTTAQSLTVQWVSSRLGLAGFRKKLTKSAKLIFKIVLETKPVLVWLFIYCSLLHEEMLTTSLVHCSFKSCDDLYYFCYNSLTGPVKTGICGSYWLEGQPVLHIKPFWNQSHNCFKSSGVN